MRTSIRTFRRRQQGITLLEVIVVIALIGIMAVGLSSYAISGAEEQRDALSANHMRRVVAAAERYVADNAAALMATATATTPTIVTIAQLKTGNYLGPNVPDTNAHGQTYEVRVLQPTPGRLSTLIITNGGETISERSLRRIARQIGPEGGYVSSATNTVATGAYQGWSTNLSNFGASAGGGRMAAALFFRDGAQVTDYLYRGTVPGRPEANTMGTSLNMGGNAIINIGSMTPNTMTVTGRLTANEYVQLAIVTPGAACASNGLLARQANGRLASCVSGAWVGY